MDREGRGWVEAKKSSPFSDVPPIKPFCHGLYFFPRAGKRGGMKTHRLISQDSSRGVNPIRPASSLVYSKETGCVFKRTFIRETPCT